MPDVRADGLGDFLRHRRGLVSPEQVGLPRAGRRRVPGLRREELAIVAGVSPDHYQRVEQGRVAPSAQVLDALATALGLDDVERAHLHALGRRDGTVRPERRLAPPAPEAGGTLRRVVEAFEGPAYVLDHRRQVLAWNAVGAALVTDFARLEPRERNMAWLTFTDPAMRTLYVDWSTGAREQVAVLRRAVGLHPADAELDRLVGRLMAVSGEFAAWWGQRQVREKVSGTKTLDHPLVGRLVLDFQVLRVPGAHDREVFLYLPATGESRVRLKRLAAANPE